jgi:hypothetical protein
MLLAYIYRSITHRVHFLDKASRDLFICAKDLFVEAIMVLQKPSSLLIEHDGLMHFEERPLDRRLRQSVPRAPIRTVYL